MVRESLWFVKDFTCYQQAVFICRFHLNDGAAALIQFITLNNNNKSECLTFLVPLSEYVIILCASWFFCGCKVNVFWTWSNHLKTSSCDLCLGFVKLELFGPKLIKWVSLAVAIITVLCRGKIRFLTFSIDGYVEFTFQGIFTYFLLSAGSLCVSVLFTLGFCFASYFPFLFILAVLALWSSKFLSLQLNFSLWRLTV